MSLIDPSFVRIVADGLGIHPSTDAAKTLAPDVENRLREIVQVRQSSSHRSINPTARPGA